MAILETTQMPIAIDIEGYQGEIMADITFVYYRGIPESSDSPAVPPSAEIQSASWDGLGIGHLFNAIDKDIWKELEQRIVAEKADVGRY